METMSKWHPQFLLYKFYNQTKELQEYENIFNTNQSSFIPISTIVTEERRNNAAK
jgi:hypothetical protein